MFLPASSSLFRFALSTDRMYWKENNVHFIRIPGIITEERSIRLNWTSKSALYCVSMYSLIYML